MSSLNTNIEVHTNSRPAQVPHSAAVMRQTQGLIGLVLLASTSAAYFAHPAFLILPAIIGTGLLVSGFSGVCPMAFAIARLPWNKAESTKSSPNSCCGRC